MEKLNSFTSFLNFIVEEGLDELRRYDGLTICLPCSNKGLSILVLVTFCFALSHASSFIIGELWRQFSKLLRLLCIFITLYGRWGVLLSDSCFNREVIYKVFCLLIVPFTRELRALITSNTNNVLLNLV